MAMMNGVKVTTAVMKMANMLLTATPVEMKAKLVVLKPIAKHWVR